MSLKQKDWYNELYRIFSCSDTLLTQTQALKLGECLRAMAAGENVIYKLEDLYQSVKGRKKISDPLEIFMHQYTNKIKNDAIDQEQPKIDKEESNYGSLQTEYQSGSADQRNNAVNEDSFY